jgi:thiamine-phosphate pyrophosphorylase
LVELLNRLMKMLSNKLICLITEGILTNKTFLSEKQKILDLLAIAIESTIDIIQIREKQLDAEFVFELTRNTVLLAKKSSTKILVNERFDIAIAAESHGVHLTSTSLPVQIVRSLVPDEFIIGVSTHSKVEIENAILGGANFVTYGPISDLPNKTKSVGIAGLKTVVKEFTPFPILGLGGVTKENYLRITQASSGFASIGFLNSTENIRLLFSE